MLYSSLHSKNNFWMPLEFGNIIYPYIYIWKKLKQMPLANLLTNVAYFVNAVNVQSKIE